MLGAMFSESLCLRLFYVLFSQTHVVHRCLKSIGKYSLIMF